MIGLAQTGWPKLENKDEKPWQTWCVTATGIVCHKIRDDKGADTFRDLVGKYFGVIVCDVLKTSLASRRRLSSRGLRRQHGAERKDAMIQLETRGAFLEPHS